MTFFDASKIPEGKETKNLLIAVAFFSFWTAFAFVDLFGGAIKFRGASQPTNFGDSPFWVSVFALLVVFVELLAFRFLGSAIIAFVKRRKTGNGTQ